MTALLLGTATLVGLWFVARVVGRGKPCPMLVAAMFDNRLAERLSGTSLLIERADVRSGMRVLDAGCGPGRMTIPLARQVGPRGEVVALDMQGGMLDRVRANAEHADLSNVVTLLGALDAETPALRGHEDSFDRILLVTVLGEIPNQPGALVSLRGALKLRGILSITEMIIDPDYVGRGRVRHLAEHAGLRMTGSYGSPLLLTVNFTKE